MKKLTKALTLGAVLATSVVALVSCGNTSNTGDSAKKADDKTPAKVDNSAAAVEKAKAQIAAFNLSKLPQKDQGTAQYLFVYKASDPFISGVVVPGFKAAFDAVGWTSLKEQDANELASTQAGQVRTAVGDTPILIVNAAQPATAGGVINIAQQNDKPVVFFNREMNNDVLNKYPKAWFVGTDRRQPGDLQGQFVAGQLIQNFARWDKNGDGKIQYFMLLGQAGNPEAEGRTTGAKETTNADFKLLYDRLTPEQRAKVPGLDNYKGGDVLAQLGENTDCAWSADKAKTTISTQLTKEKPEVIFSNNDGMAVGALQALNQIDYNKGITKDGNNWTMDYSKTILLTGCDGLKNVQQDVAMGKVSFTVFQDGVKLAAVTTQAAVNVLNGKDAFEGLTTQFQGLTIDDGVKKARVPYSPITMKVARANSGLEAIAFADNFELPNLKENPAPATDSSSTDKGKQTPGTDSSSTDQGKQTPGTDSSSADKGKQTPGTDNGKQTPSTDSSSADKGKQTPGTDNGKQTPGTDSSSADKGTQDPAPEQPAASENK